MFDAFLNKVLLPIKNAGSVLLGSVKLLDVFFC